MDRLHDIYRDDFYNNSKKMFYRTILPFLALMLAVFDRHQAIYLFNYKILFFRFYHVVWFGVMLYIGYVLFPWFTRDMKHGKIFAINYMDSGLAIPEKQKKKMLEDYTRKSDIGALKSLVAWVVYFIFISAMFYSGIIGSFGIYMSVIVLYLLEELFIFIYCPFRDLFIKNKCCNSCRIYNWGYLMVFSPFVFVPNFWTYSIIAVSFILFVQWEYLHYKHPERFFELYNANLMCKNCKIQCGRFLPKKYDASGKK